MARVERIVVKMDEAPKGFEFVEATSLDFTGRDDKTLVIFNNGGGEGTATFKMGTGIQGVADVTVTVPSGLSACALNSGSFKQLNGENKGDIVVEASSGITAAVVEID